MGSAASIEEYHTGALRNAVLDHSSVATLRAVTDAVQASITNGPTTWKDVERYLHDFGRIDVLIRGSFPGAKIVSDTADTCTKLLHEKGYTEANTLFAASVCPDEINHAYNNLSQMFTRNWGECFQMGGLAGIPFSGKTGFGAFSHHIPDDGNLFILFAPHIGISPNGKFGYYARTGQCSDQHGTACGAAVAAYNHVKNGGSIPDYADLGSHPFDYQQQFIVAKISQCIEKINNAEETMVELVKQMYDIIDDFVGNIVTTDNVPGSIALLGGIHINTPHPMEDFFWPIKFEIHQKGFPVENLLEKVRSDLVPNVSEVVTAESRGDVTRLIVRSISATRGNLDESYKYIDGEKLKSIDERKPEHNHLSHKH
jgi:hypothetical protein